MPPIASLAPATLVLGTQDLSCPQLAGGLHGTLVAGDVQGGCGTIQGSFRDRASVLTEPLTPWPCARPGAPSEDRPVSLQASLSGAGSRHGRGGGAATSGGQRPGLGWGGGQGDRPAALRNVGSQKMLPSGWPPWGTGCFTWFSCGVPGSAEGSLGQGAPRVGRLPMTIPRRVLVLGDGWPTGPGSSWSSRRNRRACQEGGARHPDSDSPLLSTGRHRTCCDIRSFGGGAQGAFWRTPEHVFVSPNHLVLGRRAGPRGFRLGDLLSLKGALAHPGTLWGAELSCVLPLGRDLVSYMS